ncbi:outer membrane beta-barrel protein [Proteiniphilum acetatigenes]|uniref:outer membrane beta-barrel protein n=1 Tax=Proteiniphilum acetatigenes TaxID=294710 RepID=UPI0003AA4940|nr:outer membrane beta-barrel protein [Proteiniphilum acetatigenes]SFK26168.1 Outer membrane protein beta-barrel domain-containing protein [Porphyromonadaceae bacterium KH3CP3RA]
MMSDNDIRKGFQSKLSGFEAPVPPDGWQSVERSLMAAAAARTALRRRWYAGSVAAVLILLVGSILFIQNPMEQTETMVSEMTSPSPSGSTQDIETKKIAPASESVPKPVVRPAEAERFLAARTSGKAGTGKESVVRSSSPAGMLAAWMEREKLQRESVRERMDNDALRLSVEPLEKGVEQKGEEFEEETITVRGDEKIFFTGVGTAERGEGTLLLAVNGRGGLTGYQQTVNSPMTLRSMSVAPDNKYMTEANKNLQVQTSNATNNVSEMEHDQPVSFGITVSKYLLDDLSIETGLVYSYLHSKTRNTDNYSQVDEVQKLHYLGIPLNVNYNLFSLRQLNVYASIGGMVEKDVYGEFRRIEERQATANFNKASEQNASEGSEEKEITKISQRNPQISVNAGVGLSYPIYDRLRLYGKVGGAYYFDAKNQHKTIYSDRKIVMDLNVGVRYEF